ncbi:MAG: aminotransferase class I/II-fold pyridoxal phosphate-dependent enzyme, partial [Actinomycetota bacterium]
IERAFQEGVKVYLLCSPQNPVGLIHSEQDLREIATLAKKYDAVVISDEIHAPLAWEPFTPFLALGEDAEAVGITISSSSKAFNTAGLKAAFLITQSDEIRRKIARLPEALHFRAAILGAFAMAASFKSGDAWLDETVEQIRENYIFLGELLEKELPKARLSVATSTYLAFIDLADYGISHPAKVLLDQGRVALVAGSDHSNDGKYDSFVRFNFATSKENIEEAVARMKKVLAQNTSS